MGGGGGGGGGAAAPPKAMLDPPLYPNAPKFPRVSCGCGVKLTQVATIYI